MSEPFIQVRGLRKSYRLGRTVLDVLRGVSLNVGRGEFLAVVGASGSGKSTLLHLLGLLDRPGGGSINIDGRDTAKLSGPGRNRMRCLEIGFVFQFYHLLPELNVLENAMLPARVGSSIIGWFGRRRRAAARAREILAGLGLDQRLRHRPKELSGGERQRVAIARALMNGPMLLLADEPTGNLDSATGRQILDVLNDFHRRDGRTTIMVTHDESLAAMADRIIHIRDGKIG